MIGWFREWLARLVKLGVDLAAALIGNLLSAPLRAAAAPTTIRSGTPAEAAKLFSTPAPTGADPTRHWVADAGGQILAAATVRAAPMPDPLGPARSAPPDHEVARIAADPAVAAADRDEICTALLAGIGREVEGGLWAEVAPDQATWFEEAGFRAADPEADPGAGAPPKTRRMWRP